MTSFQNLVDLSFGGPEDGQVNFNALHSLMYALVYKLKLMDEKALLDTELLDKVKESTKNFQLVKALKDSIGVNSFVGLAERLKTLESYWEGINSLPTNQVIIKAGEANIPNQTPLSDMWDKIKTGRMVEANEQGIQKIMCMLEDLLKFEASLEDYNKELSEALLGPEEIGEDGLPVKKMGIREAIELLGKQAQHFEDLEKMLANISARIGDSDLPSDDFFDNLPNWAILEQMLKGTYENVLTGKEKRALGDLPISEELRKMMADIGAMAAYNDELLGRIQTLENNLQYLTDRAATKADIQKLNVKMAEVQGIASAVDRLLCRIQGSEDQLCCLRQVINKIYGCVGTSANSGKATAASACLGSQEGFQGGKGQGGGGGGAGSGGVSETQLKLLLDQLTKIECEMDSIKRNMISLDGMKADVQNLFSIVNELDDNKLDKCVLATELAQKADKSQVEDKVSQTCFENVCHGLNSVVSDILTKILENDAECRTIFGQLERLIQSKADKEELESLKDQLESKLKCMAKSFIGLQKFVTEDGEGDDGLSFKRNVNQNRNDPPTGDAPPSKSSKQNPLPSIQTQRGPPPSLPLGPGMPGNKVIRQFPLLVKGVEIKGANVPHQCGIKEFAKGNQKSDSKKSSLDEFKLTAEQCKEIMDSEKGKMSSGRLDNIPQLPDVKQFVEEAQNNLAEAMNSMKVCFPGMTTVDPCATMEAKKEERNGSDFSPSPTAKLADKTVYSGLLIGADPKNQLTMDFESKERDSK